jgi:hypothetical protein
VTDYRPAAFSSASRLAFGRNTEMMMSKPSKEFINPKTLIAPAAAVYSHIAKVNRGTIVYISG